MDAQLKAKWVEALRSGEYQQGEGRLYNQYTNTHCCLGVLCVVAGLPIKPETGNGVVGVPHGEDDYGPIYKLIGEGIRASELWRRNDGNERAKHSFANMAAFIEEAL